MRDELLEANDTSPIPQDLSALIQALREAGDDPTPALLEAILSHGAAAVAPLRGFLEELARAGSIATRLQEAAGWAAVLLSQLGAAEAVPLLLALAPRCAPIADDLPDMLLRLGDPARPALHAYLRGDTGKPDPGVRERVVRALGEMGYHAESAALLIERVQRLLDSPRPNSDLAQMYGYGLLAMRAPEARAVLEELEQSDAEQWFPETEECVFVIRRRGPAPARPVADAVAALKHQRAWRSLHPGAPRPTAFDYKPRPERDPEEQSRKRAARQARHTSHPAAKAPGKASRRR